MQELIKSWTSETALQELSRKHHFNEILEGVVRSVTSRTSKVRTEEGLKEVTKQVLVIALPGGITGYCQTDEFSESEFRNYSQFIGQKEQFMISAIDLNSEFVLLSGKAAQQKLKEGFWTELESLKERELLNGKTFKAVVTSLNERNRVVHVKINGQSAFIKPNEWSWNRRDVIDVQRGETIEVRILRYDKEQGIVAASRRLALPDPYKFLSTLRKGDFIAGKVSEVSAIHGIFVQLENGLDVKAGKISSLEEPEIGDTVSCRIVKEIVRKQNGQIEGRVLILNYPNGKRRKKDLGSFLFE
ncbi:S1 RNA-binding domain-containing protein [Viridibacillus arvi]|uniref:S1 RNA-binding domain-containing protein n=1 Tax=Viridibacillus arvi TaxID=263475 RepID=UPI003D27E791